MSKHLYKVCAGASALLTLAASLAWAAEPNASDVVARAGTESITRGAVATYLNRYFGRAALRELELRSALRQEAARYSAAVADADIDARAAELKKTTGDKHQQLLDDEGISEATWRDRIRYALLAEKVADRKWPVTDMDLQRYSVRYARTLTQAQARDIIQEAKNGVDFRLLAFQRGLDKENDAYVAPNPFFRVDAPQFFRMTQEANLRPGQIAPRPIPSGKYWLVLKLEKSLPAETLSARERDAITKRIRAIRATGLPDLLRRRYKAVETYDPEAAGKSDDALATVAAEKITRKDLNVHLLKYLGRQAVERLAERAVVTQEAGKLNVQVSDAEVNARVATLRKATGEANYQKALETEGITEDAWRERVRYSYLAEKVVSARAPLSPEELTRLTVRYIQVPTAREAAEVAQALHEGARFDAVMAQHSMDRNSDGYLKPKPFARAENPSVYKMIVDAGVQPRQVVPQPVQVNGTYVVLWLEARQTAADMKPEERDALTKRINALRLGEQLDAWKKEIRVQMVVPMDKIIAEAQAA